MRSKGTIVFMTIHICTLLICATSCSASYLQLHVMLQDVLSRLSREPSIIPGLLQLLSPQQTAGKEAAVSSLALLTGHSADMARQCSLHSQWQAWLLCLLKHEQPATRLAACVCLQNICSQQASSLDSNSTEVRRYLSLVCASRKRGRTTGKDGLAAL